MNYFSLSDHELHSKTLGAAVNEKKSTFALLEYLAEVDRRRLYAERGFSSLWIYVHQELGYSEAQASERVGAMRLMIKIPAVKQSLITNKLTLTSAAKLATFVKREKPSIEKTVELLSLVNEKSSREVERLLLAEQKVPDARPDLIKVSGTQISRITFDADEEFMGIFARLKEMQSDPSLSLQSLFKKTMKEYIEKRTLKIPKVNTTAGKPTLQTKISTIPNTGLQHTTSRAPEVKRTNELIKSVDKPITRFNRQGFSQSRYIPISVKTFVRLRSNDQCEYVVKTIDEKTKQLIHKRCDSRSQLQFDHIKPYAIGGDSSVENIRHLCRSHNFHAASKVFGMSKMLDLSKLKKTA